MPLELIQEAILIGVERRSRSLRGSGPHPMALLERSPRLLVIPGSIRVRHLDGQRIALDDLQHTLFQQPEHHERQHLVQRQLQQHRGLWRGQPTLDPPSLDLGHRGKVGVLRLLLEPHLVGDDQRDQDRDGRQHQDRR